MTPKHAPAKTLRQRALEYLGKREYSTQELAAKLAAYADENDDIPALVDEFKTRGWVSDQRFTTQLVHARQSKFGRAKIAHELREKGIDDALISSALTDLSIDELQRARTVWQKKFKALPQKNTENYRNEWAKQARFLQSRGFGFEIIKQVLTVAFEE